MDEFEALKLIEDFCRIELFPEMIRKELADTSRTAEERVAFRLEARQAMSAYREGLVAFFEIPLSAFCGLPYEIQAELNRTLMHEDAYYSKLAQAEKLLDAFDVQSDEPCEDE